MTTAKRVHMEKACDHRDGVFIAEKCVGEMEGPFRPRKSVYEAQRVRSGGLLRLGESVFITAKRVGGL